MSVVFSNKFVQVGVGLTLILVGFTLGRVSQETAVDNNADAPLNTTASAVETTEPAENTTPQEYQVLEESNGVEIEKALNISSTGENSVVATPVLKDEEDSELNIEN